MGVSPLQPAKTRGGHSVKDIVRVRDFLLVSGCFSCLVADYISASTSYF
nr:MAG TPA: hypothetical protein [Caudoviricetes sp.]